MAKFEDRIKDLKRVKAVDLHPDPRNWRQHPAYQREAIEMMLSKIGWADAVIAREGPDGKLILVDGHLRADLDPDAEVPTLIVDLDESEAGEVLATLDPIAGMAGTNPDALELLVEKMQPSGPIAEQLEHLISEARPFQYPDSDESGSGGGGMEPIPISERIIVTAPRDVAEEVFDVVRNAVAPWDGVEVR